MADRKGLEAACDGQYRELKMGQTFSPITTRLYARFCFRSGRVSEFSRRHLGILPRVARAVSELRIIWAGFATSTIGNDVIYGAVI